MLKQPSGIVRLTNVAVVRLKKKGKRFEIACYRNKVVNWRNGVEKDLDEVLQTTKIFTNVSKGHLADSESLMKAFDTDDENEICLLILKKGQLQVSEKERNYERANLYKEIASLVATKCINTETKRPFPVDMVEQAMKDIHFSVHPTHSAKQQAVALIGKLKEVMPIARAQMRLHLEVPAKMGKDIKAKIQPLVAAIEDEMWDDFYSTEILINPGDFRLLDSIFNSSTKGQGVLEVVDMSVKELGDQALWFNVSLEAMYARRTSHNLILLQAHGAPGLVKINGKSIAPLCIATKLKLSQSTLHFNFI